METVDLNRLMLICLFTGLIHMIETLSYSARLAGIRTGRLYMAGALFSLFVLVARTANLIQAPLLGSLVDTAIIFGNAAARSSNHSAWSSFPTPQAACWAPCCPTTALPQASFPECSTV